VSTLLLDGALFDVLLQKSSCFQLLLLRHWLSRGSVATHLRSGGICFWQWNTFENWSIMWGSLRRTKWCQFSGKPPCIDKRINNQLKHVKHTRRNRDQKYNSHARNLAKMRPDWVFVILFRFRSHCLSFTEISHPDGHGTSRLDVEVAETGLSHVHYEPASAELMERTERSTQSRST